LIVTSPVYRRGSRSARKPRIIVQLIAPAHLLRPAVNSTGIASRSGAGAIGRVVGMALIRNPQRTAIVSPMYRLLREQSQMKASEQISTQPESHEKNM
jgi:hypothetical protein